jgi:cytochrome c oxidase subunit 2
MPHHTVKMDAVPGMPTYFIFRPTLTTAEYRQLLKESPEYQQPFDPKEPNGPKRWEKFDFEIACAELCGKGHYSMRRVLKIVSADEYKQWLATQKSFYLSNVRNKDEDPNKGKLLPIEISQRAAEISMDVEKALSDTTGKAKTLTLKNVFYETGAATLTADSRYELDNLVAIMNKYPNMRVEISGHTDNVGDPAMNLSLSQSRAAEVVKYLQSKAVDGRRLRAIGFGETKPLGENDTEEGRAANRRTEFRIL